MKCDSHFSLNGYALLASALSLSLSVLVVIVFFIIFFSVLFSSIWNYMSKICLSRASHVCSVYVCRVRGLKCRCLRIYPLLSQTAFKKLIFCLPIPPIPRAFILNLYCVLVTLTCKHTRTMYGIAFEERKRVNEWQRWRENQEHYYYLNENQKEWKNHRPK